MPSRTTSPAPEAAAPETCEHPNPVRGVLSHEFGHYSGAMGPEGLRRTVTYYGPVVGGRPISAWHCEACGLLRLDYPDGRHEERQLWPGPQPGLLATTSDLDAPHAFDGRQGHVSGLSVEETVPVIERIRRPAARVWLSIFETIAVVALGLLLLALAVAGVAAMAAYSTPPFEGMLMQDVAILVGIIFITIIVEALIRHYCHASLEVYRFAREEERAEKHIAKEVTKPAGKKQEQRALFPAWHWVEWIAVPLLVVLGVLLLVAGIAAVVSTSTPPYEGEVMLLIAIDVAAIAVVVIAGGIESVLLKRAGEQAMHPRNGKE